MRFRFVSGYLFGKTGFPSGHKKSMGDNLVHALGPEKTRKNQTSYAHPKSADVHDLFEFNTKKFLRFQGITEQIANAMINNNMSV
jgi:hypothetical protein